MIKVLLRDWSNGSEFKSRYYSCKEPELSSCTRSGDSTLGKPTPPSEFCGYLHRHANRHTYYVYFKLIKIKLYFVYIYSNLIIYSNIILKIKIIKRNKSKFFGFAVNGSRKALVSRKTGAFIICYFIKH